MTTRLPIPLDDAAIDSIGRELDELQNQVKASLGAEDRRYVLRVIRFQRGLTLFARGLVLASLSLHPRWGHLASHAPMIVGLATGAVLLGISKILENMEIGHNVLHGQWDWMRDPTIHSSTWEWDLVCPAEQWKRSHNVTHHTWTNVLGKDHDVGYNVLRVTELQRWRPQNLLQPFINLYLALFFQWGVAVHDVDFRAVKHGKLTFRDIAPKLAQIRNKALRQLGKDYVLWPLLGGPLFLYVVAANLVANTIRNVWTYMIIFCGHFPDGSYVFTEDQIRGETRGGWYVRQMLGSCNIEGGTAFHILTGHLSHQIEHHIFPDMPSRRYPEVAVRVRALCERHGIPYNSGSLSRQFGTTTRTILRLAFPSSGSSSRTSSPTESLASRARPTPTT